MLLFGTLLTACVSPTGSANRPTPVPFITPHTPFPSADAPSAAPMATTSTPSAAAPPPAAAAPAAVPPVAPVVLTRTFALMSAGASFVRGTVQVTERNGAFTASVNAAGLPPSTLHTVHIHLGSCANPYGGMHLTVLGLLGTNAAGTGTLTAGLAPVYVSPGHYVIVYATSSPQLIAGCANLGSLA